MKKFWNKIKEFWTDHEEWLAPLAGLVALIAGLFGISVACKKANEKIENEQKRKEEEEQKRIDAIPEKEMYELYTLSDETGVSVSKFTDSGMRLDVVVTDPETNILSDDSKYKYNNCYIDVQGYRLDQLGQFGRDVMNTVGGTKEDTRVNLNEVSLRATEKKEEEAQQ